MKYFLSGILVILLMSGMAFAQTEEAVTLTTETGNLEGTLMMPGSDQGVPVALFIAGSGPTDRNGNNPVMRNDALKMLARGLSKKGIATLRYDKRGVGESTSAGLQEEELRFDHYVEDAKAWIEYLQSDDRFPEITVIGHSEGALIGMIAAQEEGVVKFVSIAGAGVPANQLIRRQLHTQPPLVMEQAAPILQKLEAGTTTEEVPQMLLSLFRPSVQPYLISWFAYDPQEEIAKLEIPVLIIQGTTDIQVSVDDAQALKEAAPEANLKIIEGMNHILKEAPIDRMQNIATYSQPDLPLKKSVVEAISTFMHS